MVVIVYKRVLIVPTILLLYIVILQINVLSIEQLLNTPVYQQHRPVMWLIILKTVSSIEWVDSNFLAQ